MIKEVSLKQKAYQYIKSRILFCEYASGSFLNEKRLMEEIEVSRTPIREALSRLEQEGLVTILPKRGVTIKEISVTEINMLFQSRELIETFIIRKDGYALDRQILMKFKIRMLKNLEQVELSEINKLDDEFHIFLTSGSKNIYLLQVLEHMYFQLHRLRIMSGKRDIHRVELSQIEHLQIIEYLLAGDFDKAAEADSFHLAKAREAALALIINP